MPYLQVDLDAMDAFADVATATGLSVGDVSIGLLKLWRHCWKAKATHVSKERLQTFFACDLGRLVPALEACEFVDRPSDRPDYHVRGSEKRLGILENRSRAGKRRASGKRDDKGRLVSAQKVQHMLDGTPAPVQHPASTSPGLTSNIQHPASNKKIDISAEQDSALPLLSVQDAERTDGAAEVVAYYRKAMAANGIETRVTDSAKEMAKKRLEEGVPISSLKLAIDGLTWSDWHMGRDPKTNGASFHAIKYAIGSIERIEAMVQRVPVDKRGVA